MVFLSRKLNSILWVVVARAPYMSHKLHGKSYARRQVLHLRQTSTCEYVAVELSTVLCMVSTEHVRAISSRHPSATESIIEEGRCVPPTLARRSITISKGVTLPSSFPRSTFNAQRPYSPKPHTHEVPMGSDNSIHYRPRRESSGFVAP